QDVTVLGVKVVGLTTIRPAFSKAQTGYKIGDTITIPDEDISSALERIYRTGLFSDVKIVRERTTAEGVYLKIIVQEQPRLNTYKLEGIKSSQREDLKELIGLLPGFAITKSAKTQAVNTIEHYFKKKGHWYTKVDVEVGPVDTVQNRATLYFHIDAGERLEIKDISFTGNEAFSDKQLRKA